ncbi:MAG: TraR/DksA family transcriptional regulator [Acidimicrobiia bacterium]|nr:TraR/DksA family transcriptional regulator [Acidimicrobiia bacterium]
MAQVMSKAKVSTKRQGSASADAAEADAPNSKASSTKASTQARKARSAGTTKAEAAKPKAKATARSKAETSKTTRSKSAQAKSAASKTARSKAATSKPARSAKAQSTTKSAAKASKATAKTNGRSAGPPLSKAHARLSRKILDEREKLVRQAEELEAEQQALAADPDAAEMSGDMESGDCVASREREVDLRLAAHIEDMIAQIDRATERLNSGTYGQCARCHDRIPAARLEALPYAELCVSCQEKHERLYY